MALTRIWGKKMELKSEEWGEKRERKEREMWYVTMTNHNDKSVILALRNVMMDEYETYEYNNNVCVVFFFVRRNNFR